MHPFLAGILVFNACATDPPTPSGPPFQAQHVVIVVQDGVRLSETFGDTSQVFIPRLGAMAAQGVLFANFRNDGETYTCPGHVALSTGVYQAIDNSGAEWPAQPGMFQRFLEKDGSDSTQAWIVSSKGKLLILADCVDPAWQGRHRPVTDCGVSNDVGTLRDDSLTLVRALEVLAVYRPRLMLISFGDPDVSAHTGDWNAYTEGIRRTDGFIGRLWDFIGSDDALKDRTAMLVTNDHGRHLDSVSIGFAGHGDGCAGCRDIFLLAVGPDFRQGAVSEASAGLPDVAATVDMLLNVPLPPGHGRVLSELFP